MTTFLVFATIYVGTPALLIFVSGRQVTWRGWLIFLLLWPIGWLFMPPEELP